MSRDRRDKRTRRRDEIRERDGATDYDRIKAGELEPQGEQKGWKNLRPEKYNFAAIDKEKHREISRKGARAVQKMHGEKKTAKQVLENVLTLVVDDKIIDAADLDADIAQRLKRSCKDVTVYDLIQTVAAGRAVGGNMKAIEYIRDTYGDMPVKQVEITENITTDADREMLRQINERLKAGELAIVEQADIVDEAPREKPT